MPTYKLNYFDVRGRAELSRYVFVAAKEKFEDNRIKGEDWPEFKKSCPFGQLPYLEVDGKTLAQSDTIARFLAKEFGLMGKTNWDEAQINQFLDIARDMMEEIYKALYEEKDEAKKAELQKKLAEEGLPKYSGIFEKALVANGGSFIVGSSLSVADLAIYAAFDTPLNKDPTVLDKSPKLKAVRATINALPGMEEYIASRTKTDI